MRDYSKMSPTIWQSRRFIQLPSDMPRYLYLYYLTNQHQNSAGCYGLPDKYACSDLNWSLKNYRAYREQVVRVELIRFEQETSEILIERWFQHNPPMNPNHRIHVLKDIGQIKSPTLKQIAAETMEEAWKQYMERRQAQKPGSSETRLYSLNDTPTLRRVK